MIRNNDIKNLRLAHSLTLQQMSRAIFVEDNTLSNYEAGRRTPSLDMLEKIANVFGCTVDFTLIQKLIEETYEYLKLEENIPRDVADKVCYIDFDLYGDIWRDELLSDNSRLLDINKEDLGVDHEFIFDTEFNPLIYNAQSMDVLEYLRENPIVQIKY